MRCSAMVLRSFVDYNENPSALGAALPVALLKVFGPATFLPQEEISKAADWKVEAIIANSKVKGQ
jgi:hypothetical protein